MKQKSFLIIALSISFLTYITGCATSTRTRVAPLRVSSLAIPDIQGDMARNLTTNVRLQMKAVPGNPNMYEFIGGMEFVMMGLDPNKPGVTQNVAIKNTAWFAGAEHTIVGTVQIQGWTFRSDQQIPLVFQLIQNKGYVYQQGRGTVISPQGQIYELGRTSLQESQKVSSRQSEAEKNPDDFEHYLSILKDDNNWGSKLTAVNALRRMGDRRAVEPLLKLIDYPKSELRFVVIYTLGVLGDDRVIEPLIQKLQDEDSFIRFAAAKALNEMVSGKTVEPLIDALDDSSKNVRMNAAEALGKIGDHRAIQPLRKSLIDADKEVRIKSAKALIHMGDTKITQQIISDVETTDPDLWAKVIKIIGEIKEGHPIIGKWSFDMDGCTETYEFHTDGTRNSSSAEEVVQAAYTISAKPLHSGFYRITDRVIKDNGKRDCSGSTEDMTGDVVEMYVQFNLKMDQIIFCHDESLDKCFGPFRRN